MAPARLVAPTILVLRSIELYANYVIGTARILDWSDTNEQYQRTVAVQGGMVEAIQASDQAFYRMMFEADLEGAHVNDPRLYGFDGVSYFGSFQRDDVYRGLGGLGLAWWENRMQYFGGMPSSFDGVAGLRYVISDRRLDGEKGYVEIASVDGMRIYRNDGALPIALLADPGGGPLSFGPDPFENLNATWRSLTGGGGDVFTREPDVEFAFRHGVDERPVSQSRAVEYSRSFSEGADGPTGGTSAGRVDAEGLDELGQYVACTFVARLDGPVYCYAGYSVDGDSGSAGVPMKYVGTYKKGDAVEFYLRPGGSLTTGDFKRICAECYFAYEDQGLLASYACQLQGRSGTLEKLSDSHLAGEVEAAEGARLFFTIPYDGGWTLTVDGAEVPLEMDAGPFMSAPIPEGAHSWELRFFPVGMREGVWL